MSSSSRIVLIMAELVRGGWEVRFTKGGDTVSMRASKNFRVEAAEFGKTVFVEAPLFPEPELLQVSCEKITQGVDPSLYKFLHTLAFACVKAVTCLDQAWEEIRADQQDTP